jgi:hypothetical protein
MPTPARRPRVAVITGIPALLVLALGALIRQPVPPGGAPVPPQADPGRLEADVRALTSRFQPRDAEHPENLARAAAWLEQQLKGAGAAVSHQEYGFEDMDQHNRRVRRGPFLNVIADFGPETPERIVVGAHYDAYGPFPAADDNASGTAGLLELGRLLGREAPPMRVELVAYSTEEPPQFGTPHMGSVAHARALRQAGAAVRAMLSLEMLGYFSDKPGSQGYPSPLLRLFYPSRGDFIAVVSDLTDAGLARRVKRAMRAGSVPVYSITAPAALPGIDWSDHSSYWAQGYPAVMIGDTAFYRNRLYHKPGDTADRLDYKRMAGVVDGVNAAVRAL